MSWFSIPNSFLPDTSAKSAEVNANFDAVETALNGLFKAGKVEATKSLELGSTFQAVPGCSLTITPALPSILIVNAVADLSVTCLEPFSDALIAEIFTDGVAQPAPIIASNSVQRSAPSGSLIVAQRGTYAQNYCISLTAAKHTIEMKAKDTLNDPPVAVLQPVSTGFTYLLIPNPAP